MSSFCVIIMASFVVAFLFRAKKLYRLIKLAASYSIRKAETKNDAQAIIAPIGCLGMMCFPFSCFFFITPIYLLFKIDWWIPILSYIVGLTIGNLILYLFERFLKTSNHHFHDSAFDLNALELTHDEGLYKRTFWLLIFYNVASLLISLIIIFYV